MIFIIINKNILIHLISYLIIENGIFLFSLSLGGEMPMIVNTAILLDIFSSVLLLGIFLNKIGTHYKQIESESLTNLKD
jgi:hydrogenase-4 component E